MRIFNTYGTRMLPNDGRVVFSMLELAEEIVGLTNSDSKLIFRELSQDDPMQRKPVIELAKCELDWEPYVTLKEGLKKTIAYFQTII